MVEFSGIFTFITFFDQVVFIIIRGSWGSKRLWDPTKDKLRNKQHLVAKPAVWISDSKSFPFGTTLCGST